MKIYKKQAHRLTSNVEQPEKSTKVLVIILTKSHREKVGSKQIWKWTVRAKCYICQGEAYKSFCF